MLLLTGSSHLLRLPGSLVWEQKQQREKEGGVSKSATLQHLSCIKIEGARRDDDDVYYRTISGRPQSSKGRRRIWAFERRSGKAWQQRYLYPDGSGWPSMLTPLTKMCRCNVKRCACPSSKISKSGKREKRWFLLKVPRCDTNGVGEVK